MLIFVGLGLYDERSITIEGQEAIQAADTVFAERYTATLTGATVEDLEAFNDVAIEVRPREGVESDPKPMLAAAESETAALLVAGDPMVSTTHVDLRLRAHERGIDTRVVNGTSAQTAASSLTGLQNYRFGKATTLPFPNTHGKDDVPASVLETIDENRQRGLHTLVYLDIDADRETYLTADAAASLLSKPNEDLLAVAIARAGCPSPVVRADSLSGLARVDFGQPLHLLVVPGTLHDMEAQALIAFGNAPSELLETRDTR